ncbi:hypothetical protein NC651_034289 [Populus alba x Populus x berolinensis]|nr:hypothetical protein NC651_034289 [Populus alba x Populus x berolinensis]
MKPSHLTPDHHELMFNYHSLVFSPPSLDFHYLEMVVESRYLPYCC